MNSATLIAVLYRAGVKIEPRGDRLHIEAPSDAITPELKATLAAHKVALLAALSDPLRIRLQQLAAAAGVDPDMVRTLDDDDLAACDGLSDEILRNYVTGCSVLDCPWCITRKRGYVISHPPTTES